MKYMLPGLKQKRNNGSTGEHLTNLTLNKLPSNKYIVLNNLLIMAEGIYHQIDHVVISAYGIFVIETKDYSGFITGEEYDKYWIRHVPNNKKYYYLNPIRQNYGHIKGLAALLHLNESVFHNIVCIPSDAELRIKHNGELSRYDTIVERIMSYRDIVIDNVIDIEKTILRYNIEDINTRNMYIGLISGKGDKDQSKCPKCGGELVLRDGKYGKFHGCSNYPKCKYVRK